METSDPLIKLVVRMRMATWVLQFRIESSCNYINVCGHEGLEKPWRFDSSESTSWFFCLLESSILYIEFPEQDSIYFEKTPPPLSPMFL